MSTSPNVTVLIPTYNRASFLEGTLGSVFGQTVPVHEVILVDDGCTDDTSNVVKSLLTEHPEWEERLHYVRQENQGKSVALNKGLERVAGDWIAFNDSDDRWLPEKLEWQFRALEQFPDCGACFTDARFVNNAGMGVSWFERALKSYPDKTGRIPDAVRFIVDAPHGVSMCTVLVRTEVMRRVGAFDPQLRVAQDTDFLFRLARETELCYVNVPLVEVDRAADRTEGLTSDFSRKTSLIRPLAYEKILVKWRALSSQDKPVVRRLIRSHLRSIRSEIANWHLTHQDPVKARRALLDALEAEVTPALFVKWLLVYCAPRWAASMVLNRSKRHETPTLQKQEG